MVTDPLFAALPGPRGPLRTLLDNRLAELAGQGHELAADLVLVVASLADRIDDANAGRAYRGFVMLTAEYRAARRDLLEGLDDGGADPLEAALAEFRAAEEQHPARLEPPY